MNINQRSWLIACLIAGFTVAAGFVAWWTFLPIAFAAAFYLARHFKTLRVLKIAGVTPAVAWVLTALVRDLYENMRISHKLAGLLHVRFGVAIYAVLFVVTFIPCCLAAYSGNETSKALR